MHCTLLIRQSIVHAVDKMYGRSLSKKMRARLQPKETKVRLY